jgi:uncharacterized protein
MSAVPEPTRGEERIAMLDTMRGVAVLGILLMNITGFGMPRAYDDPTNWGGHDGANLIVWRIDAILFEGTMRGLFTLLFGAGALLFIERHQRRAPDVRPAGLYFRRTLWLIPFGLLNGYLLLWDGDILYFYGVGGLVLYAFRNMNARRLIVAAAIVMSLQTLVTVVEWTGYHKMSVAAHSAEMKQQRGGPLTGEEHQAIENFRAMTAYLKPRTSEQEHTIAQMRASYSSALADVAGRTWYVETEFFLRHGLLESIGMMLLGMALYRLGVLTGATSARTYIALIGIGYGLGLPVNVFEVAQLERDAFSVDTIMRSYLTYDLGRVSTTLGHLGLIGLLCRAPVLSATKRALAAVGQMALSNYLAQSVICMFVFTGAGLALYGQLERYQLYYIVLAIWVLQIAWSPVWLSHFRFGPAEWAWRSLTYWRRQPMRHSRADPAARMPAPVGSPLNGDDRHRL